VITIGQLTAFAATATVLIVIPGPGVLFIVGRAIAHGRRTAVATACGHATGSYLVVVCVAFGIGAAVQASAAIFGVVRLAGAAYLAWLGVQAIRGRRDLAGAFDRGAAAGGGRGAAASGGRRAARDGFVVGITNPKAFILFGAILPQFVSRGAGHIPAQMLLLGLVAITIGLVSDSAWGLSASSVRDWFARSPRRFAAVGGAGGLAMIAVAVTIAVTGRSD
jgi:threonine/homoserine/homoserine lactone efflux protein